MTIRDYDDVPGTYVLDSRNYRKGYYLNMFLMSLNKSEARATFAADEKAYLLRSVLLVEEVKYCAKESFLKSF